ncbi:MAG: stage II sporulation protein P [Clostridia bacterium]|nr:stage II sporulation protein P [Clostridia bacterium]
MNKRTNLSDKIIDFIMKSIIPIILAVILLTGGKNSIENLIKTSLYIVNPEEFFEIKNNDKTEDIVIDMKEENIKAESAYSEIVSSEIESEIPEDVRKLIEKAEKEYENSSNDGEIISLDYSKQNATAKFNEIYLRNTTLNQNVNIEEYLNKKVQISIIKDKPSVLIYHTHTTETYEILERNFYTNSRSTRSMNSQENMVRIGEEICKILEENGYKTIHDKTIYDEKVSGAYDRSRENISKILKDNPSIQVALDVHRDSIYQKDGSRIKTVAEVNGRKVAQIMIISGCEDGNVTNFPNWKKNLTFALGLQEKLAYDNKNLMRPLMFCSRKYNMDLIPCALSIEIGTDANTITEAVYSAQLFANSLSDFLEEY